MEAFCTVDKEKTIEVTVNGETFNTNVFFVEDSGFNCGKFDFLAVKDNGNWAEVDGGHMLAPDQFPEGIKLNNSKLYLLRGCLGPEVLDALGKQKHFIFDENGFRPKEEVPVKETKTVKETKSVEPEPMKIKLANTFVDTIKPKAGDLFSGFSI